MAIVSLVATHPARRKESPFSQPCQSDVDATVIYGVSHDELQASDTIVSNGSCTTNCIVPVIQALDDAFEVDSGTITTIHASMHDQQVIDAITLTFGEHEQRSINHSG